MTLMTNPNMLQDNGELLLLEAGFAEKSLKGNDTLIFDNDQQLYGVFDGVGLEPRSGVAANITAHTIRDFMFEKLIGTLDSIEDGLIEAMEHAHSAITDKFKEPPHGATTATVAKLVEENNNTYLVWASVGDSRLYLKDPAGNLSQITEDEGEGRFLSNVLGIDEYFEGVLQHGTIQVDKGSDIVLVTDGITGDYDADILSPEEILHALDASSAQAAAQELLHISRKRDDKTAIVIRC